jgi:imidazole glycerol-phosphate synthase subunit HisH
MLFVIGILDLGINNLRSLSNAVHQNGFDFRIVEKADALNDLTHLIVPGLGNFRAAMDAVDQRNLRGPVRDFAMSQRPLLGVCLGMQLLAAKGTEGGDSMGFGLVPGTVRRMQPGAQFRIPHMGWNALSMKRPHPIFKGLKNERDFYFVHSYAVDCDVADDVLGETEYGGPVTAVIGRGNVVGFQFHPEKSEVNGLKLVENFCLWDGRC